MSTPVYCTNCGTELAPEHRYCPRCGTARWTPPEQQTSPRPTPEAGMQPFQRAAPRAVVSPALRWLPYLFGAGAVFWLINLAQFAAVLAAPAGRDQLHQALINTGITPRDINTFLVVEAVIVILFEAGAAALHAAAYFGLRRLRIWGWIAAVIVSAAWSLLVVGIPVLVFLLRRSNRAAFGLS